MNQIIHGDSLTELKKLDSESVDCCITSPPYWNLRDYKVDGQLGLEKTVDEYVNRLVTVFDEVKRVLKKTGSCWIVLGDTYDKNKSLSMVPERFAIAMIDHDWVLRNKIVWQKGNCMPSSVKDRFTVDWEYVYFFTKSQRYFFETQYEPMIIDEQSKNNAKKRGWNPATDSYQEWYMNKREKKSWHDHTGDLEMGNGQQKRGHSFIHLTHPLGRIKRCVWKISTKPFSDAHFAVFPPDLVEPMLLAGCPEFICKQCRFTRKLEYEETRVNTRPGNDVLNSKSGTELDPNSGLHQSDLSKFRQQIVRMPKFGGNKASGYDNRTYSGKEWNPIIRQDTSMTSCNCNAGWESGTVLDPFFGSGTTGMVALQHGRNFIGIELNPNYVEMAKKRLEPLLLQSKII